MSERRQAPMLTKLRSRLNYANVVSTLCLFILLGGTAWAVEANSVGTAQLKDDAVTTPKLAPGAVGSRRLRNDAVSGAKVANESLTGADINEGSLADVNAASVGGLQVRKIRFDVVKDDPPHAVEVLNLGGLVMTAECRSFGDGMDVKARTTKDYASAELATESLNPAPDDTDAVRSFDGVERLFRTGQTIEVDNAFQGDEQGHGVGTLHYVAPDGSVVVVEFQLGEDIVGCSMSGVAIGA